MFAGALFLLLQSSWVHALTREGYWLWNSLNGHYQSWLYDLQLQWRDIQGVSARNESLITLGFGKKLSEGQEGWSGASWVASDDDTVGARREYRLWEEHDLKKQGKHVNFVLRSRLEQRWLEGYSSMAVRFRLRPAFFVPLADKWQIFTFDEMFFNLNHVSWLSTPTWDQNRSYLGLEYQINLAAKIGCGYMYRFINSMPTMSEHIAIATLFINMDEVHFGLH